MPSLHLKGSSHVFPQELYSSFAVGLELFWAADGNATSVRMSHEVQAASVHLVQFGHERHFKLS